MGIHARYYPSDYTATWGNQTHTNTGGPSYRCTNLGTDRERLLHNNRNDMAGDIVREINQLRQENSNLASQLNVKEDFTSSNHADILEEVNSLRLRNMNLKRQQSKQSRSETIDAVKTKPAHRNSSTNRTDRENSRSQSQHLESRDRRKHRVSKDPISTKDIFDRVDQLEANVRKILKEYSPKQHQHRDTRPVSHHYADPHIAVADSWGPVDRYAAHKTLTAHGNTTMSSVDQVNTFEAEAKRIIAEYHKSKEQHRSEIAKNSTNRIPTTNQAPVRHRQARQESSLRHSEGKNLDVGRHASLARGSHQNQTKLPNPIHCSTPKPMYSDNQDHISEQLLRTTKHRQLGVELKQDDFKSQITSDNTCRSEYTEEHMDQQRKYGSYAVRNFQHIDEPISRSQEWLHEEIPRLPSSEETDDTSSRDQTDDERMLLIVRPTRTLSGNVVGYDVAEDVPRKRTTSNKEFQPMEDESADGQRYSNQEITLKLDKPFKFVLPTTGGKSVAEVKYNNSLSLRMAREWRGIDEDSVLSEKEPVNNGTFTLVCDSDSKPLTCDKTDVHKEDTVDENDQESDIYVMSTQDGDAGIVSLTDEKPACHVPSTGEYDIDIDSLAEDVPDFRALKANESDVNIESVTDKEADPRSHGTQVCNGTIKSVSDEETDHSTPCVQLCNGDIESVTDEESDHSALCAHVCNGTIKSVSDEDTDHSTPCAQLCNGNIESVTDEESDRNSLCVQVSGGNIESVTDEEIDHSTPCAQLCNGNIESVTDKETDRSSLCVQVSGGNIESVTDVETDRSARCTQECNRGIETVLDESTDHQALHGQVSDMAIVSVTEDEADCRALITEVCDDTILQADGISAEDVSLEQLETVTNGYESDPQFKYRDVSECDVMNPKRHSVIADAMKKEDSVYWETDEHEYNSDKKSAWIDGNRETSMKGTNVFQLANQKKEDSFGFPVTDIGDDFPAREVEMTQVTRFQVSESDSSCIDWSEDKKKSMEKHAVPDCDTKIKMALENKTSYPDWDKDSDDHEGSRKDVEDILMLHEHHKKCASLSNPDIIKRTLASIIPSVSESSGHEQALANNSSRNKTFGKDDVIDIVGNPTSGSDWDSDEDSKPKKSKIIVTNGKSSPVQEQKKLHTDETEPVEAKSGLKDSDWDSESEIARDLGSNILKTQVKDTVHDNAQDAEIPKPEVNVCNNEQQTHVEHNEDLGKGPSAASDSDWGSDSSSLHFEKTIGVIKYNLPLTGKLMPKDDHRKHSARIMCESEEKTSITAPFRSENTDEVTPTRNAHHLKEDTLAEQKASADVQNVGSSSDWDSEDSEPKKPESTSCKERETTVQEIFLSNINQETSPMITTVNYHQPDVDKPSPSMTEYQSDHGHDPGGVVGTPTIEDQKTASESAWDSDTDESGAKKGDGTLCHDHKMKDSEEKHPALTNNDISNHINITGPLTNVSSERKSTESKKLAKKKAPRKEPQQSSDSNWDSDSDSSGNQQLVQDRSMSNDEQRCRKNNLVVTDIKEKVLPVVSVATGIVDHTNEMNKDPQLSDEKPNTKDELLDMVHKIDSDSNWDSDEDCKTKQPENSVQMEKDSSQPEICVSNTNQETSVMIKASSKVDNHQPVDKHSHSLKGYRSDDGQDPGRVITKSTIEGRKSASMSDWDSDTDDPDDKKGDGTLCHDHKMRETATVLTITKGENTALTGNDISNHINISVPLTNVITEPKSKEVKTLAIKTTPGNEPHQSSDSNWDSDSELSGDQDKSMPNDEQRVQKANLVVMDIEEDELPVVPVAVVNAAHGSSVDHTNAMNKDPQISDDKLNTKDELLDMVQKIDSDSDWDSDEESETKEPKNSIYIAKDSTKPEICLSKTSQHTSPMITTLPTVNYHQPDVDKPSPLVTENQSNHRHDPGGVDIKPTIEGQKTTSESDWDSDTDESGAKKGDGTLCHDHRMKESTTIITIAKEKPIVLTNDISDHINTTGPLTNVLPEPKSTKVKTVDKEKTSRKEPQQSSDSNWDSDSDSSGDQPSVQDKSIPNDEQRCQKENLVVTDKKEKILPDVPVAIGIGDHTNEMNKDPQFSDEKPNTKDELLDMVIDSDFDWDSDGESETEKPKNDIYNEKESTQQANLKSLFDGNKEKSLRETAESTGKCIDLENQKPSLATSACRSDHKSPEYHEIAGSPPVKCPDSTPVLNWDSDNGDSEDMEKGTILEGHRMKETAEKGNHVLNNTTYHRDNTETRSDKSPDKRTFIRDDTPKGEQHLSSDSNWDSDSDPLEDQLSIEDVSLSHDDQGKQITNAIAPGIEQKVSPVVSVAVADHGAVMDHTDGIQKDHQSSEIKPATNEELLEVQSFDFDFDWDSGEESESEKPKTSNSIGKDLTRQAVQKTPSDGNAETSPLKTLEFNVEHHEFEDQKPNSPTSKYKFDHKSSEHCETAGESPVPCPNYTPVSGLDSDIDDLDDMKEKETLTQDMLMSVKGQKRQLANFAVSDVKENVSNSPLAIADDDASSITNDRTHQLHRTNEDKPIAEDGLLDMVQNFDSDFDWDSDEESETEKPKSSNLIEKNSTQHEMQQENKPVSKSVSREVQDSTSDWDSESESEPEKSNVDHQKGNTATVQEFTEKGPDDRGKHSPGSNVAGIVTKQDKRKVFSEIDVSSHCTGDEDVIDGFPKDLQEKQSGYFEPSLSDWGTESTTSDLNEEENKDHLNALVHYISSVHIGWSNEDLTKEKENISKTVAKDEVDEDEIHQRSDASKDSHDLTPTFDTVEVISLIPEKEEKRRDAKSPNSESRIKSDRYQIEIIPSEKLNELTKDGQNIEIEESDDEDISCIDLLDDNSDMKAKSISSEGDFYEDSGASSSNEEKPQNHVSSRSERKAKGIPNIDDFEDFHGYTYETSSDEDQNERNRHETERELLSNKTCVQQNKVLKPDFSDTCQMNKYPETDIVLETGNSQVACGNEEERILPNVKLKDVCVTGKETETIKKNDPVKGKSISILDVNDDDINYLSKAENVKNVKLRSENICDSGEKTSPLSHESQVTRILNIDFDEDNSNVAKAKHVEEVQLSDEDFSIPCIHLSDDISGLRNDNNRFSDGDFQDNSSVSLSDEDKPERKIEVGTASSRNLICDESSNIGRTKDVHGFLLDSQHDREPTDCNYLYTYRTIKGLHSAFPDGSCANSSDDEMPTNHGSVRTERKPRGIPSTEDFSDCNGYTYETSSDEDQNERNRHETEKELLGNTTFVQQNKVFKPDSSSPYQMNKYTDTDIVRDTRNSQEAYENEEVCILPNLKFKDVCITGKDTDTTRASDPVQEKSIFTLDFKDDDSNNLPKAENDEEVVELELNVDDICGTGAQTKQHGNQSKGTRISNLDFDEDNRNVAKSKRVEEVQSSDEDFSIPCIRLSEDISGLRNDNSISSDGDFQDNSSESSSDEVLQERQIEEDTASSRNEKSLKSDLTRDKHTIPLDPEHDIGSTECSNTYRTIKDVLFAPDLMPGQRETTPTSEECMRTAMTSNFMKILMKEEGDRNTSHSHLNESNNSKGHNKSPRRDGGPQRNLPSGGAVQNPTGLSSDVTEIHRLKTISSKITDGEVGIHPLDMGCYQTNCNLGKEQPLQNQYRKEFQPLHDDKIKEESIATQNIRTPSKPTLSKTFTAKYLSKKKGSVGANTSTTEQMISNNDVKLTKQCQKKPVARGRQYTAKYLARHNTTAPLEIPTSNYDTPDVRAEREVDRQNPQQNASNRNRQFTAQYLTRRHDQGMSYDTPNERTEPEADCQDPQQIVSHRNRQFTAQYLARRNDQSISNDTPDVKAGRDADCQDPKANASHRSRQFTAKYLAKRHDQGDFKGGSTAATYPDTMGYWKDIALCESDGGSTCGYNRNEILRCGTHCSSTDAYHRNVTPCHDYDFSETNTYNRRDLPYLDTDSSSIYAYQRRETLLPSTRSVSDDTYYCKENPYLDYDCSNVDTYQVNEMPRRISDYQNLGSYHRRDIF